MDRKEFLKSLVALPAAVMSAKAVNNARNTPAPTWLTGPVKTEAPKTHAVDSTVVTRADLASFDAALKEHYWPRMMEIIEQERVLMKRLADKSSGDAALFQGKRATVRLFS